MCAALVVWLLMSTVGGVAADDSDDPPASSEDLAARARAAAGELTRRLSDHGDGSIAGEVRDQLEPPPGEGSNAKSRRVLVWIPRPMGFDEAEHTIAAFLDEAETGERSRESVEASMYERYVAYLEAQRKVAERHVRDIWERSLFLTRGDAGVPSPFESLENRRAINETRDAMLRRQRGLDRELLAGWMQDADIEPGEWPWPYVELLRQRNRYALTRKPLRRSVSGGPITLDEEGRYRLLETQVYVRPLPGVDLDLIDLLGTLEIDATSEHVRQITLQYLDDIASALRHRREAQSRRRLASVRLSVARVAEDGDADQRRRARDQAVADLVRAERRVHRATQEAAARFARAIRSNADDDNGEETADRFERAVRRVMYPELYPDHVMNLHEDLFTLTLRNDDLDDDDRATVIAMRQEQRQWHQGRVRRFKRAIDALLARNLEERSPSRRELEELWREIRSFRRDHLEELYERVELFTEREWYEPVEEFEQRLRPGRGSATRLPDEPVY